MANMPLALPLRAGGAEVIRILLLGDWKRPKPKPQSISRQMISKCVASVVSMARVAVPKVREARPIPPRMPA